MRAGDIVKWCDMRTAWRLVEESVRLLGTVDCWLWHETIFLDVRPRWWLRALGLGRWARRRAIPRVIARMHALRPDFGPIVEGRR